MGKKQAPSPLQGQSGPVKQVVIASLPGAVPEVYVCTLTGSELSLREAEVQSGEVSVGTEVKVDLIGATITNSGNGEVAVLKSGKQVAALHFETEEEELSWLALLKDASQSRPKASAARPTGSPKASAARPTAGSPGASAPHSAARRLVASGDAPQAAPRAASESEESEVARLQAKSRQLQGEIQELEAVGARRDKQLQRLMKRLDGSIEMLQAVQDMCNQQRKVIYAQRVAIVELKRECGEQVDFDDNEAQEASSPEPVPHRQPQPADEEDDDDDDDEEDVDYGEEGEGGEEGGSAEDLEARTRQLMALLAQAESMQGALQASQAGGNTDDLSDLGGMSSELTQLMAMMGMSGGPPGGRR